MRHGAHALLLAWMLAGCASSPPERFYILGAGRLPPPAAHTVAYRVVVEPVTIPALVDRPQMVLRTGTNRVTLAEQSRWAEPLKDGIGRSVAANLAALLSEAQVATDARGAAAADYRVLLDVQDFDSAPGDAAMLDMLWTVRAADDRVVAAGRSVVREAARGRDYDAIVAAHDRALAAASREIAAAIRAATPAHGGGA
jgi:uncharacterized lipoprotein YmbA